MAVNRWVLVARSRVTWAAYPPLLARLEPKRDEVGIQLVIDDLPTALHAGILTDWSIRCSRVAPVQEPVLPVESPAGLENVSIHNVLEQLLPAADVGVAFALF